MERFCLGGRLSRLRIYIQQCAGDPQDCNSRAHQVYKLQTTMLLLLIFQREASKRERLIGGALARERERGVCDIGNGLLN